VGGRTAADTPARCDVIVPVYNGLAHLRPCVESVLTHTHPPYRLVLADDCSDEVTTGFMREVAATYPHVEWRRNEENLGFVANCNRALAASSAEYAILLNSDTLVSPRWLEKMLACGDSDPRIAAASPLSNYCPYMNIPMLPGYGFLEMADLVEALSDRVYPDVTTCEGFCLLLPRRALDALGGFDEIYSPGYGEESDYCMRAVSRGWRTVSLDDTYIYHAGRGSFGEGRTALYERNSQVFHSRWNELYRRDLEDFKRRKPIDYLRKRIERCRNPYWLPFDAPPPPRPKRPGRRARLRAAAAWLPKVAVQVARRPEPAFSATLTVPVSPAIKQAKSLGRQLLDMRSARRGQANLRRLREQRDALRIAFLLPCVWPFGGVIVAANVANEMVVRGHDVKLFNISTRNSFDHRLYTEPASFRRRELAAERLPETDIIVATQWETVEHVARFAERHPHVRTFYFVQGNETVLLPEEDRERRRRVEETYRQIRRKVVMTEYLRQCIVPHDPTVFKVAPALDQDTFYPCALVHPDRRKRVLCMARPDTPWRGFDTMCQVFEAVHRARPDTEFVLYGTADLERHELRFPYVNAGVLPQRDLPRLYSSCALYCDFSHGHGHGLGLTSLEAMACGGACVLTESGGPSEYAVDGWNALLREPGDPEALAEAITCLLDDAAFREQVAGNGLATAGRYSHRHTADQLLGLFRRALAGEI
jgi:GT2 family glycosyltransferase